MLTAVNIPKDEAEAIVFLPDDSVLISIGEEHEPFWKLQVSGDRVFRLTFSDVTQPIKKGDRYYNPMNNVQARAVVAFIELHQSRKFIVNCRAGISRSAAICLFIHQQYGHLLKPYFQSLSYPNSWVIDRLKAAQQSIPRRPDLSQKCN